MRTTHKEHNPDGALCKAGGLWICLAEDVDDIKVRLQVRRRPSDGFTAFQQAPLGQRTAIAPVLKALDHLVAAAKRYKEFLAIFRQAGKEPPARPLKHLLSACESANRSQRACLGRRCTTYSDEGSFAVIASVSAPSQEGRVSS